MSRKRMSEYHLLPVGRRLPVLITVALAALVISSNFLACSRTDEKAAVPPEKVTLALSTPPYTVLADLAQAQGYFRQEGLEATPHFHSTGIATLNEALAGKADFISIGDTPFMFAIMRGEKLAIIATIQTSNKADAIFARKDKGIRTPLDLKGKKIGVTLGTGGDFFLGAFLAIHGVARKDIQAVNLKPEEMLLALTAGDVDALSVWSPFLNQAQNKLGDRGLTFYGEDLYTQTFNIAATQESIHRNPGRVKKLLRALIKAEEFAGQQPAKARQIVADTRQMDRASLDEAWADNTFRVSLDQSLLLALEDESRWAIKAGLAHGGKIPNYLDFVYLDGLASVKPAAVRILR